MPMRRDASLTCPCSVQLPSALLGRIKACAPLLSVVKTLKESNIEFLAVDSRTVITDHPSAGVGVGS